MKTRREFIKDMAVLSALAPAYVEGQAGDRGPEAPAKPPRNPLLWCSAGGIIGPLAPPEPSDLPQIRAFAAQMGQLGVTRMYSSDASRMLVMAGREHGIDVVPYSKFNLHGGLMRNFEWSLNYTNPPLDTPQARAIMEHHRPTHWERPPVLQVTTEIARAHPELWVRDRTGRDSLWPNERISLSLASPEVRAFQAKRCVSILETTGARGLQLEFLALNENPSVLDIYGFETPMVAAYEAKFGSSPFDLGDDDPAWLQFKSDYVTQGLAEARAALRAVIPRATLSVSITALPREDYLKALQDWPAWIKQGAIDELCLWFRQTGDIGEIDRRVADAAAVVAGRCPLIAELSTYHPGSCLQEPKIIVEAARRAMANGATAVGLYTATSIDQLGLWPALQEIARL